MEEFYRHNSIVKTISRCIIIALLGGCCIFSHLFCITMITTFLSSWYLINYFSDIMDEFNEFGIHVELLNYFGIRMFLMLTLNHFAQGLNNFLLNYVNSNVLFFIYAIISVIMCIKITATYKTIYEE